MLGVNAGSGQRRFENVPGFEWINLDCASRPGQVPDHICDIAKDRWPCEDGTVDCVIFSHSIEHFHLGEGDPALIEAYRVLRPEGSVILTFPNIREVAKAWLRGSIDDFTFGVTTYGAWMGLPGDDHHWHWSSLTLAEHMMKLSPWSKVKTFDFRPIPGVDLPTDWWIDSLECIK